MRVQKRRFVASCLGFLMLFTVVGSSMALDEMVLNGVVRSIDMKERLIYIDVKSADCNRRKAFRFNEQNAAWVSKLMVGQELRFATDQFRCSDQAISLFIPEVPGGKK